MNLISAGRRYSRRRNFLKCPFFLIVVVLSALSPTAAFAEGPSVRDIEKRLESRYSSLDIERVRVSNKSKQQAFMGELHDGLFTASASVVEPLYAIVATSSSGTIIREIGSPGDRVSISGGFEAMRDAGMWRVELSRVEVSPRLGDSLAAISSYNRKPIALEGTSEAIEIRKSEDRRIMERREREIARQDEARRRKEAKEKRAADREALRLKKEKERQDKAALEASYEAWEDAMARQLVGKWQGSLLHGIPAQPYYQTTIDNKHPECNGYIEQRLTIPEDGYNDFHRFIDVFIETTYVPDRPNHIMVLRRISGVKSRIEPGRSQTQRTRLALDGKTKTVSFGLPSVTFFCDLIGSSQRGNLNFFQDDGRMVKGVVSADKITFEPQTDAMKNGERDYRRFSAVLTREPLAAE